MEGAPPTIRVAYAAENKQKIHDKSEVTQSITVEELKVHLA